jgi:hypothetical protein
MTTNVSDPVREEHQSLWLIVISPGIWTAHFVVSYVGSALWCGKGGESTGLVTLGIVVLGIVALAGIAYTGLAGWRKHRHSEGEPPHGEDTPEDRHRFLGFATVLLSGLSALATLFVVLSAVLVESGCH